MNKGPKFKKVITYVGGEVGGYMNEKTLECGSWVISRTGSVINDVFIHWSGEWVVERNGEIYGNFKTKKESIGYVKQWLTINPNDI